MNFRNYVTTEKDKIQKTTKGAALKVMHREATSSLWIFGIKALETKWITGRQIEAARIAVTRYMQRQGQIWIRIFPDKPITRKPADVRMGKGKGSPEGFVLRLRQVELLLKLKEYLTRSRKKLCVWQLRNFRLLRSLS